MITEHESGNNNELAWVLTPGFLKVFRACGIWDELIKMGLAPDIIVGTSVGAYVGIIPASKLPITETMAQLFKQWSVKSGFPKNLTTTNGMYSNIPGMNVVKDSANVERFEQLPVKFAVVTTDIKTGQPTTFVSKPVLQNLPEYRDYQHRMALAEYTPFATCPSVWTTIEASLAMPGVYQRRQINGRWYEDGGMSNPVPVDVAKMLGAKRTILIDIFSGINPNSHPEPRLLTTMERVLLKLAPHDMNLPAGLGQIYHALGIGIRQQELVGSFDRVLGTTFNSLIRASLQLHPPDVHIDVNRSLDDNSHVTYSHDTFQQAPLMMEEGRQIVETYRSE